MPTTTYAPLRQPGFPLFLASLFITTVGTQMQLRALGWQIQQSFASSPELRLGLIGLAEAVPSLSVALFSGHLADVFDRKRLMQASLGLMLACSIGMWLLTPWAFTESRMWLVYAMVGVGGLARSVLIPSRAALGIDLVPHELIPRAVALRSFAWMAAAALGPLLAGPVIGWPCRLGTRGALACDATAIAVAGVLAACIRYAPAPRPAPEPLARSLRAGVAFVRGDRLLIGAMSLDLFAVLFGGATALLPTFAVDVLHTDAGGYSVLAAAPEVGAIAMAVVMAHLPPIRRAGATMLGAVVVFGLCMIGFALSRSLWLSTALLGLSGIADTVSVLIRSTLIQVRTPPHLRGRVASVNAIFVGSSNEIGAFESGAAARWLGLVPSVVLGGILTQAVVAATALLVPSLRRLDRLATPTGDAQAMDPAQTPAVGGPASER